MRDLIWSPEFWAAMILAIIIKLRASPRQSLIGVAVTIIAAVLSALVFTLPLLDWLDLSGDAYVSAVAALVALSAEHIARQIYDMKLIEIIRAWRGK